MIQGVPKIGLNAWLKVQSIDHMIENPLKIQLSAWLKVEFILNWTLIEHIIEIELSRELNHDWKCISIELNTWLTVQSIEYMIESELSIVLNIWLHFKMNWMHDWKCTSHWVEHMIECALNKELNIWLKVHFIKNWNAINGWYDWK